MSLSKALAQGRDHNERAQGHVLRAYNLECEARFNWESVNGIRDVHAARLEWAMAVCALLAWVRYGEGER